MLIKIRNNQSSNLMFKNSYKIKYGGTVTKIVRQKIINNLSFLKVSAQTDFIFELAAFFTEGSIGQNCFFMYFLTYVIFRHLKP